MRRTTIFFFQLSLLVLLILGGCHGGGKASGETDATDMDSNDVSEEVLISRSQFEASGMQIGNSGTVTFSQEVKANGYIEATPQGIARVASLVSGRVTAIYVAKGDQVSKGQRLFAIEGNELIQLQQDYAEAVNMLDLLRSNYERQQALADAEITARKELIRTENEFRSMRAKAGGLKAQLALLSIDPEKVAEGKILPGVSLVSPISGHVTGMQLILGQVIEPGLSLMEIVGQDQMQLNIHVYENVLDDLAAGQKVRFYKPEQPSEIFEATLRGVGHAVDNEARTIECIAELNNSKGQSFVHGLFVEAEIITCEREAEAIPQTALIVEHEKNYVLVKTGEREDVWVFTKQPVEIGVIQQGFAELTKGPLEQVLVVGGYQIAGE